MSEAERLIGKTLKAEKMDSEGQNWKLKEGDSRTIGSRYSRTSLKYKLRYIVEIFATLTIGFGGALGTICPLAIYSRIKGEEDEVFKCLDDTKISALVISSIVLRVVLLFGFSIVFLN